MLPARGSVLGIDVGWSQKQPSSAVCRLDWDEAVVRWTVRRYRATPEDRREAFLSVGGNFRLLAVAIDGPLRRDLKIIGRYRKAEEVLTRRFQKHIGKPGQSSSPNGKKLNEQANISARAAFDLCQIADAPHQVSIADHAISEAFPTSYLGCMLGTPIAGKIKRRSDTYYKALTEVGILDLLIAYFLPGRHLTQSFGAVTNHDDRAALVCALTALGVAANNYVAVGDEDGWIILPPWDFIAAWSRPLLEGVEGVIVAPTRPR